MSVRKYYLLLLMLAVGACAAGVVPVQDERGDDIPARILFVGNSFTYYNDSLHSHLRRLVQAGKPMGDRDIRFRAMTLSGATLSEHTAGFSSIVNSTDWDVVVLQGHSLEPISAKSSAGFNQTATEFDRIVRESGARTVFFMTWAYEGEPQMTAKLARGYNDIGRNLGAQVVPVGLAFARVTLEHPGIVLRHDDKKHPTLAGTYLAACVFYASLYQQSPVGLAYAAGLSEEVARVLQMVAWQIVSKS